MAYAGNEVLRQRIVEAYPDTCHKCGDMNWTLSEVSNPLPPIGDHSHSAPRRAFEGHVVGVWVKCKACGARAMNVVPAAVLEY